MTLQSFSNGPIDFPTMLPEATIFVAEVTLDNQDEKFAVIFSASKTGNISHVGWKVGTVTSSGDVTVSIQGVDPATGLPDGTPIGTGGTETVDTSEEYFITALGAVAAVTVGDVIAIVITVDNVGTVFEIDSISGGGAGFPYVREFTGSWVSGNRDSTVSLKYDDGLFYQVADSYPFSGLSSDIINTSDTPNEVGLRFKFPFPVRSVGFRALLEPDGDCEVVLYDADNNELQQLTVDSNFRDDSGLGSHRWMFPTQVVLAADTEYRLTIRPTTGTDIRLFNGSVKDAGIIEALAGYSLETHYTSRKYTGAGPPDPAAFSEVTTKIPFLILLVDQFDDGAGGGDTIIINRPRRVM